MCRRVIHRLLLLCLLLVPLMTVGVVAVAEDAASFYRGKTIRLVTGTGVGGGFDTYARMIAPHLAKALDATVIVENKTGAGGLIALNGMYAAAGDALQIQLVNGNAAALAELLDDPAARFEISKLSFLGLVGSSPWIWIAATQSKFNSADEFMKSGKKVVWGGAGQLGGLSDGAAVTCSALNLDCQIIRAYDSSAQAALALARGEVDSMYVSDSSAFNYVKAGNAKPILTMSTERSKLFPDLPTAFEALKLTEEQKWWLEFRAAIDDMQRVLAAPPKVAPDRLAFMRAAVKKVLTDPEVIREGEKRRREIDYRPPEVVEKMVATALTSITPARKKAVREVIMKE